MTQQKVTKYEKGKISYPYHSFNNTKSIGTRIFEKEQFVGFQYFRKIISDNNWKGK